MFVGKWHVYLIFILLLLLTVLCPRTVICDSSFYFLFSDLCFELVENNFDCVIRPEVTLRGTLKPKSD